MELFQKPPWHTHLAERWGTARYSPRRRHFGWVCVRRGAEVGATLCRRTWRNGDDSADPPASSSGDVGGGRMKEGWGSAKETHGKKIDGESTQLVSQKKRINPPRKPHTHEHTQSSCSPRCSSSRLPPHTLPLPLSALCLQAAAYKYLITSTLSSSSLSRRRRVELHLC